MGVGDEMHNGDQKMKTPNYKINMSWRWKILISFERSAKHTNHVDMGSFKCSREEAESKLDFVVNNLLAPSSRCTCERKHINTWWGRKEKVLWERVTQARADGDMHLGRGTRSLRLSLKNSWVVWPSERGPKEDWRSGRREGGCTNRHWLIHKLCTSTLSVEAGCERGAGTAEEDHALAPEASSGSSHTSPLPTASLELQTSSDPSTQRWSQGSPLARHHGASQHFQAHSETPKGGREFDNKGLALRQWRSQKKVPWSLVVAETKPGPWFSWIVQTIRQQRTPNSWGLQDIWTGWVSEKWEGNRREARGLQMEERGCRCQTSLSLLSGRKKQTSDVSFLLQI